MTTQDTGRFVVVTADIGNMFRSKNDGNILTGKLYLGCNDSADNYEEISEVEVYAETEETENGVF